MKRKAIIVAVALVVNAVILVIAAEPYGVAYFENSPALLGNDGTRSSFTMLPKSLESCTCDDKLLLAALERADAVARLDILRKISVTIYGLLALPLFNIATLMWVLFKREP